MKKIKILSSFIAMSFIIFPCIAQHVMTNNKKNITDLSFFNLIGKVKSLTITKFDFNIKFGDTVKEVHDKNIILFNESGNMIESNGFLQKDNYNYNNKENVIDENIYEANGFDNAKRTYNYDEKGNMVEISWYNSYLDDLQKVFYNYDTKGNVIEKIIMGGKYLFKYDEKGNKIEENNYDVNDSLNSKLKYKYDNKGNVIEINGYDSYGWLSSKVTYKYDNKGNVIELNQYQPDPVSKGLDYKNILKYDSKGYIIEKDRFNSHGNFYLKYTFKYDNKGNVIERNTYDYSYGSYYSKNTYKYTFDKIGNWITETDFNLKGSKYLIIEREIEYY